MHGEARILDIDGVNEAHRAFMLPINCLGWTITGVHNRVSDSYSVIVLPHNFGVHFSGSDLPFTRKKIENISQINQRRDHFGSKNCDAYIYMDLTH